MRAVFVIFKLHISAATRNLSEYALKLCALRSFFEEEKIDENPNGVRKEVIWYL